MNKFSADFIFTPEGLKKNLTLVFSEDHTFISFEPYDPGSGVEFFPGLLCPGFVNAHCHIELSHLEGKIQPGIGMGGFIQEIQKLRGESTEAERIQAAQLAAEKMAAGGIVAVGDIVNGTTSIDVKKSKTKLPLVWHNFVELFGLVPIKAKEILDRGIELLLQIPTPSSLTLHAPYSCSPQLRDLVYKHVPLNGNRLSLHCLESEDERKHFYALDGSITEFIRNIGAPFKPHKDPSPLDFILRNIPVDADSILFVHNTEMLQAELERILSGYKNSFFVLCPGANRFINNKLPDAGMFQKLATEKTCLGTDSLAGNTGLNILEEMKILSRDFSEIHTETLLTWATENGARALGMENHVGSFKAGLKPGLVQITSVTEEKCNFTEDSHSTRIR